jgi:hypothetical protein
MEPPSEVGTGRSMPLVSNQYDPETLEIDHVAEKKLIRKLDLCIVPMVMLLYLLVWSIPPSSMGVTALHLPTSL